MDIILNHLVHLDLWLKNWGSSIEQKRELFLTLRNLLNEANHSYVHKFNINNNIFNNNN